MNTQETLPYLHSNRVHVHSIFPTIQGEGPFTGRPAVFIRLHGCNLQCPHCDTDYTSRLRMWNPTHLAQYVKDNYPEYGLVVITGGEPFRQEALPQLARSLRLEGFHPQVETNGVFHHIDFPWSDPNVTVVVSPKTPKIHPKTAKKASCYKYVLDYRHVADDGLPSVALGLVHEGKTLARPPSNYRGNIYIQPMDAQDEEENWLNLMAVVDSVRNNPRYIMGVQLHKLVELP